MKKLNHTVFITTCLCLLPLFAALLLWDRMPDQVPMHWNAAGEIDGYGSKPLALLGLPCMMAGLNLFLHFMLDKDPKTDNMSRALKGISYWLLPALTILLMTITYLVSLGIPVRVEILVPLLVGVLFIAMGNYLPKCRQNYTMGIKTPWALNSEENWARTHRLGGYCFILGGFLLMLGTLLNLWWLLFPVLLLTAIIPLVYSYLLFRKGI